MSCKSCKDKKPTRHTINASPSRPEVPAGSFAPQRGHDLGDVRTAKSFKPPETDNPVEDFLAAKELSYAEIKSRQDAMLEAAREHSEVALHDMTDDMRRVYVESLVSVANGDLMSMGTLTPEQAIIGLYQLLQRDDFSFITNIYPTLKPQVEKRYEDIMKNKIVLDTPST